MREQVRMMAVPTSEVERPERRRGPLVLLLCVALCLVPVRARAADDTHDRAKDLLKKGVDFLVAAQEEDGSWRANVGITSLAVASILRSPYAQEKAVAQAAEKGLGYLTDSARPDGGIYRDDYPNYSTSLALTALLAARRAEYREIIQRGRSFVVGLQMDEADEVGSDDPRYGGVSYDGKKPPDLSNTHFAVEAIRLSGLAENDPFYEKAVVFLERLQNRKASNDQAWAVDDGGFAYAPGESKAGETVDEEGITRLRSYGSMTYAGLLSYIHAGVDASDPRVRAAYDWVCKHYTLDENPGMGTQGLFYYYHTLGKTLAVLDVDTVPDADGRSHDWRADLVKKLTSLQEEDGSWSNVHSRWMERDPALVTAYVCLTLDWVLGR